MKSILSIIAFIVVLSGSTQVFSQDAKQLDVDAFEKAINDLNDEQLIDVRTPSEFQKGYIDNALNMDINSPRFQEFVSTLDKNKPVLVYCLSGGRSTKAVTYLKKQGFRNVQELKGGFMQWKKMDKPIILREVSGTGMSLNDFNKEVTSDKLVLVDFYAQWCGPCKKMAPELESIASQRKSDLKFVKLDADENSLLVKELNIEALPGLFLFKNGKQVWYRSGYTSKDVIEKAIQENL